MKMRKLLLTCAAVASVSLAFSISAFAETITMEKDTASATIPAGAEGQMTVMVLKMTDSTTIPAPSTDNILYIDQVANDAEIFQNMKLKNALAAGDYYAIKVGGENIAATDAIYKVGGLVAGKTVDGFKTFSAQAPIKVTNPATMKFTIAKTNSERVVTGTLPEGIEASTEIIPIIKYSESDATVAVNDVFTVTLLDGENTVDAWTYTVTE